MTFPLFFSFVPLPSFSLCSRNSETQCQWDFTAKISLCYNMGLIHVTRRLCADAQTRSHNNRSDKNKRPSKLEPGMGAAAGRRGCNEIIRGKYCATGATTVSQTERLCVERAACESEKLWVSMGEKSPLSGSATQAHSSGITMNELWGCRVFPCFCASLFFGNTSRVSVVIDARFPRSRNRGQNCRLGQRNQSFVKQNVVELTVIWMTSCFWEEKGTFIWGEHSRGCHYCARPSVHHLRNTPVPLPNNGSM